VSLRGRPADASPEGRQAFFEALRSSAAGIPGVTRVGLATELPYSGSGIVTVMMPEGTEDQDQGEWIGAVAVLGDFLQALGARVVEGRPLDPEGVDADRQVALVNEAFVRTYWPDGGALDRTIKSGGPEVEDEGRYEVVGVLADVRAAPGEEPPPKMYVPYALERWNRMQILLETEGDPAALVPALRERVAGLDPGLPLGEVVTLEQVASEALARPRFYRVLFASFALVALLLATVGVYGTTAYATQSRAREFGIRLALGEDRRGVVMGAVRRAGGVVIAGAVVGTAVALLAADILSGTLRMVDVRAPGPYLLMAGTVVAAGLLAAWIPARRLSRIDPARTLREEG
jgi:putative ABC transport system permease protein